MSGGRKRLVRGIAALWPVQALARVILKVLFGVSRLWSHVRFKALVPRSGDSVCHWTVEIKYGENLQVGNFVSVGPNACLGARAPIVLKDLVRISRGAVLETAGLKLEGAPPYAHTAKPITVEEGAWIGANAIVLGGVTIGRGAVVGAGAVVSRDVPAGTVVVGAPTRSLVRRVPFAEDVA